MRNFLTTGFRNLEKEKGKRPTKNPPLLDPPQPFSKIRINLDISRTKAGDRF